MRLETLREKIASIDRELLQLVAERQQLAAEIGGIKLESGASTKDFDQEREVIHRGRAIAEDLGISCDLAEKLLLVLIESSLTVQERDRVAATGLGSGKRALVIGGRGTMGAWFVRFLGSQGYRVEVADPAGPLTGYPHVADWHETDLTHELIVVAAPLRESNRILLELAQTPPAGLVFDIGSLKSPLRPGLLALRDAGCRVTSVHPMFGPDTELLSGRHIIFVDLGAGGAVEDARELFKSTMVEQVDMDLDSHDRLIAYVLGLSHALNIAFFTALVESGEAAPNLDQLSSTTFDQQLQIAGNVACESPHLYFEIQALNDHGDRALSTLAAAVERLRRIVAAGDESSFVELMQQGKQYLGGLGRG